MKTLNFSKAADGLLPAIIQDVNTRTVLMLGYMNEEALTKTQESGNVTFYSRSKNRLWTKGEESGNFLELISIKEDCDQDTLLIQVKPKGPTCHKGSDTCWDSKNESSFGFLSELEAKIKSAEDSHDSNNQDDEQKSGGDSAPEDASSPKKNNES